MNNPFVELKRLRPFNTFFYYVNLNSKNLKGPKVPKHFYVL